MSVAVEETMHALRLHRPRDADQGPDVRWEEGPTPAPTGAQVLVRVDACVVDPDDIALAAGALGATTPVTLGRAAAGVVAARGPEATEWQPGDRVALDGSVTCGRCTYCTTARENLCVAREALGRDRDGAHASFVVAHAHHLLPTVGAVPAAEVAVATRTVAVPYHALKRAGVGDGVTVAVHGLGGRGRHAVLLAGLAGAQVIGVDEGEDRLAAARDWGADAVLDAAAGDLGARIRELTEGGVDCSLELTARPDHLRAAVEGLRPGGRAAFTRPESPTLPSAAMARSVGDELDLVGSHDATRQDIGEVLDLVADGRLDLGRSVGREAATSELVDLLAPLTTAPGDPDTVVAVPR